MATKNYNNMLDEVRKEIKGDPFESFIIEIIEGIEENIKVNENEK